MIDKFVDEQREQNKLWLKEDHLYYNNLVHLKS